MTSNGSVSCEIPNFAIVVCGSDQRLDFIPIFWHFATANLSPQVIAKVYLLGCTRHVDFAGITVLPASCPASAPWSQRILDGLKAVREENILFVTEDILFLENDGVMTIEALYKLFLRQKLSMLRLDSFPQPEPGFDRLYGPISKFSLYRVSLQPSLWKRSYLISLLRQEESIWEFELRGSRRSRTDQSLYALAQNLIPYKEVIGRGYLSADGARLLRLAGIAKPTALRVRGWRAQISISMRAAMVKLLGNVLRAQKKYTGM